MPRWFIWTLLALLFWGVWALLAKVIGDALTPAQNQVLSTIGMVPVIVGVAFSRNLGASGGQLRGSILAFAAGLLGCVGNIFYYRLLNSGAKAATVIPFTAIYPLITV